MSRWAERGWGYAVGIPAALIFFGVAVYHTVPWRVMPGEDCDWVQGSDFGFSDRLLQSWLLQEVVPYLFGPRFEAFYALAVSLHLLCAVMLYVLFMRVSGMPRSGYPQSLHARHLGGGLAGLLYLLYNSTPIAYLSAMSYQLVTLFTLATLTLALLYLQTRRPAIWLLVLASFALALASHTYGFCLVGLLGLMEIVWQRTYPLEEDNGGRRSWSSVLLRHGLILVVAAGFAVLNADVLARGAVRVRSLGSLSLYGEVLRFGLYLQQITLDLLANLDPWMRSLDRLSLDRIAPQWGHLILTAGVCILCVLACGHLYRRRPMGVLGVFLIFVAAWNIMGFFITRPASFWEGSIWRFTFNVAGLCLFIPFALHTLVDRLAMRLAGPLRPCLAVVLTVPVVLLWGPGLLYRSLELMETGWHGRWMQNPRSCGLTLPCQARTRVTLQGVQAAVGAGRTLACSDLSNLDLSNLNLAGMDLRGADLSNTRLTKTSLDGARLHGACFNWAQLRAVTARRASLRGASLAGSRLDTVDLQGADLLELNTHCMKPRRVRWPEYYPRGDR